MSRIKNLESYPWSSTSLLILISVMISFIIITTSTTTNSPTVVIKTYYKISSFGLLYLDENI